MVRRYVQVALLAALPLYGPALYSEGRAEQRADAASAATVPSPQIDYDQARIYLSQGGARNLQKARELFSKAADKGHASAAYNAAMMFDQGLGGAKDRRRALTLFQKAANAGDPDAMFTLSTLYDEGLGDLKRDPKKSREWYERAVEAWESGAATSEAHLRHP